MSHQPDNATAPDTVPQPKAAEPAKVPLSETESNGPQGLEPTRYGDWERKGRCVDF